VAYISENDLKKSIDNYILQLSEKHHLHRKIQFLLDVRGLLIVNHITGPYVEFGVYRGEMIYAAAKILYPHVSHFIGLDTFAGLPNPSADDDAIFVYEQPGFMSSPEEVVQNMLVGFEHDLIKGDFREQSTEDTLALRLHNHKISIVTIDVNWPSSCDAAFRLCAPHLQNGSIVFIDDYFVGLRKANFNDAYLEKYSRLYNFRLIAFKTYAPFARAFIVEMLHD